MIKAKDMQVFEILNELDELKSDVEKINLIKTKYSDHTPLLRILQLNFSDNIKSILPEGEPPFNKEEEDGPSKASLWSYVRQFPIFVRSAQSQRMKMLQIERIFIEMLEAIGIEEAQMFCLAKDKKLQTKWKINSNVATSAFPAEIVVSQPVIEKSDEEKAEEMFALAEMKKNQAKELNAQARQLIAEAKKIAAEA